MNKRYIITEEIESPNKIIKWVTAFDFFFALGYTIISFVLMNAVHDKLHVPFMIFSISMAIFLTTKSHFNRHRRNYESLILLSKRDTEVYAQYYEGAENEEER